MKTLIVILSTVALCFSQTINISGRVMDWNSVPISGAVVTLESHNLSTTSDQNGNYTLTNLSSIIQPALNHKQTLVSVNNNVMTLNIQKNSNVKIVTYNLQGKAVSTFHKAMLSGTNTVALKNVNGVYLYKVKINETVFVIKSCSFGKSGTVDLQQTSSLKKTDYYSIALSDTISSIKDGYLNTRFILSILSPSISYADSSGLDIKMVAYTGTVKDTDGNIYHTIRIGTQTWTAENLRTTRCNNGFRLTYISDSLSWVHAGEAYCYYITERISGKPTDTLKQYGVLYNESAISLNPAIKGWHIPSDSEWTVMQNYLIANGYNDDGTTSGNSIAKSMESTWWYSGLFSNPGSNNKSGFSALPGGARGSDGNFGGLGTSCGFWTSSTYAAGPPPLTYYEIYYSLNSGNGAAQPRSLTKINFGLRTDGRYVRLVKN